MPFEVKTAAEETQLILTGRLGVQHAAPLWNALRSANSGERRIRLQAEALEEMDTSIVQILCRLTNRLQIGEVSDGFLVSLQPRGLERHFIHPEDTIAAEPAQRPQRRRQPAAKTKSREARRPHGKKNSRSR